jgi:hypothetical protein
VVLMERAEKKNKERWSMGAAASRFNSATVGREEGVRLGRTTRWEELGGPARLAGGGRPAMAHT